MFDVVVIDPGGRLDVLELAIGLLETSKLVEKITEGADELPLQLGISDGKSDGKSLGASEGNMD
jgi:hypothetical protein